MKNVRSVTKYLNTSLSIYTETDRRNVPWNTLLRFAMFSDGIAVFNSIHLILQRFFLRTSFKTLVGDLKTSWRVFCRLSSDQAASYLNTRPLKIGLSLRKMTLAQFYRYDLKNWIVLTCFILRLSQELVNMPKLDGRNNRYFATVTVSLWVQSSCSRRNELWIDVQHYVYDGWVHVDVAR